MMSKKSLSSSSSKEDNDVSDKDSATTTTITRSNNWRTIGDDNIKLRRVKDFISDVSYGSAQVHQNYIRIFWDNMTKQTFLFLFLFAIPLLIFPLFEPTIPISAWTQEILLETLTKIASLAKTFNRMVTLPITIPINLMLMGPKAFIKILMNPKLFIKLLRNMIMNRPTGNGYDVFSYGLFGLPKSLQFFDIFIIAPIIEEIIYRFGFDKICSTLKMIQRRIPWESKSKEIDCDDDDDDDDANSQKCPSLKTRLWFGHQPWILVSSICFGLSHFSNHLPLNPETVRSSATTVFELTNEKYGKEPIVAFDWFIAQASTSLLFRAILEVVITTNIALQIYGPLYCKRGIGASIGAHIMFNVNGVFLSTSIGWRLLIRFFRKIWLSTIGTKSD